MFSHGGVAVLETGLDLDGGEFGGEVLPEVGGALDADLEDLGELALGFGVFEGGHEFGIAPGEDAAPAGISEFCGDLALFEVVGEGGKLGADALLEEDAAFLAVGIGGERDGVARQGWRLCPSCPR